MDMLERHSLAEDFAAACDWWREAGVDHVYLDDAQGWLREPQQSAQGRAPAATGEPAEEPAEEVARIGADRSSWPRTLDAFAGWWLAEPSLDTGGPSPRVPPRGIAAAELMILVPMPEEQDREELLSGPHGVLVGNMLRAMGIDPARAYLASALPRHTPLADWQDLSRQGLGEVILHHIALAEPKRILVLGRDLMPLLGMDRRQGVSEILTMNARFNSLATFGPQALLENARLRADLWQRWLDWTRDRA